MFNHNNRQTRRAPLCGWLLKGLGLFALMLFASVGFAQDEAAPAQMQEGEYSHGNALVYPGEAIAGEYGTWVVRYGVREQAIAQGGGIRVQLPDAMHAGSRNSANRLQSSDPKGDHYVSARCSAAGVRVEARVEGERENWLIKHAKPSLDGRLERYVFVVRVIVREGEVPPGEYIEVVYGDDAAGSVGYRAGTVSTGPLPIQIAVDDAGDGVFQALYEQPSIEIKPGAAAHLQLHLPSQVVQGEQAVARVSLVDENANPIDHAARVDLRVRTGDIEMPGFVELPPGQGYADFLFTPQSNQTIRLYGRVATQPIEAYSNPARVYAQEPEQKIYWGELHSHTHYSWDGVGYDAFDYARYITDLDFYTMTDHARLPRNGLSRGLNESMWEEYAEEVQTHHDPPLFVTLHAYECSLGSPYGHHNVYFRGEPGELVPGSASLEELFAALEAGEALTIPHHTGKFPGGLDFSVQNDELRRNIEIYSGHGSSEVYNPAHPLAFERSLFTSDASSRDEPSYVQDAWRMGLRFSTVAASDDHRAHPGQPHFGLTAIRTQDLSRVGVFDALYERHTYGTTGAKIWLDFSLNDVSMGESTSLGGPARFRIEASGTDAITQVELLRCRGEDAPFEVIADWQPDALDFEGEYVDPEAGPGAVYYMRLRQGNTIRGRAVMAWSSPIWIEG